MGHPTFYSLFAVVIFVFFLVAVCSTASSIDCDIDSDDDDFESYYPSDDDDEDYQPEPIFKNCDELPGEYTYGNYEALDLDLPEDAEYAPLDFALDVDDNLAFCIILDEGDEGQALFWYREADDGTIERQQIAYADNSLGEELRNCSIAIAGDGRVALAYSYFDGEENAIEVLYELSDGAFDIDVLREEYEGPVLLANVENRWVLLANDDNTDTMLVLEKDTQGGWDITYPGTPAIGEFARFDPSCGFFQGTVGDTPLLFIESESMDGTYDLQRFAKTFEFYDGDFLVDEECNRAMVNRVEDAYRPDDYYDHNYSPTGDWPTALYFEYFYIDQNNEYASNTALLDRDIKNPEIYLDSLGTYYIPYAEASLGGLKILVGYPHALELCQDRIFTERVVVGQRAAVDSQGIFRFLIFDNAGIASYLRPMQ